VPLSVGANLSGSVFELGSFTLDGVRYNDIAQTDSSARLFFELFGGGTVPPIQDQPVLFTTPFTLTGLIILPFPSPGNPPVVGRGIATVTLMPQLVDPETKVWLSQSVRYDFSDASAVPEPATLVLVGSGIVGCLLRRRQRASC